MIIKRLNTSREVVAGLHLVWDVFIRENAGSCTQQGIEEFARFIKMENFMPLVERGEMIVFGVVEGQELGGIGAVQSDGHISLLFVRPDLRRRGIAKALVNEMCRFCTMQLALMRITVNASVVSTEAYHHMGFRDLAPVQEKDGIRFVPMELMVSPANVRPSHYGKKHTGLFIGIAVTAVIFLIFLGLLFGKIIINFSNADRNRQDSSQIFEYDPNGDGSFGDLFGGDESGENGESESSEEAQGIEAIEGYEAENLPYTITEENYTYFSNGNKGEYPMQFDVKYPQITGVEGENIDKINEMLKDCAMSTVNTLYLDPSDSMKEKMLEESDPFMASLVTYRVSYAGEDFISVAFNDIYYAGNTSSQYCDLRTRNIRISDAKQFEVSDIVDLSDAFMQDWMKKMKGEAPSAEVLSNVKLNDFRQILNGEILENRYFDAFFVDKDGIEIGITYHYPGDGKESTAESGWITAPFNMKEIIEYKTDSEFWNLVQSNN